MSYPEKQELPQQAFTLALIKAFKESLEDLQLGTLKSLLQTAQCSPEDNILA